MEVLQNDRFERGNERYKERKKVRERERERERERDTFTKLSSFHPSRPPGCLGLLVGQPVPIWGSLIGSHASWAEAQKNPEHLLYLSPLNTKLIVIPLSMSTMGLLGAIGFALALVSLTQVYHCISLHLNKVDLTNMCIT